MSISSLSPEEIEKTFKDKMTQLSSPFTGKPAVFKAVKAYAENEIKTFIERLKVKVTDKASAETITVNIANSEKKVNNTIKKAYNNSIETIPKNKQSSLKELVDSFIKVKKDKIVIDLKDRIAKESEKSLNNIFVNMSKNMK